jgi:hypothetical protein
MSLEALIGIIQEFFSGITALLHGTPHYSYAILDCIGDRAGRARSPVH